MPANLSRGERGAAISALQQALRQIKAYTGPVTGFFGPLTQRAVSEFQEENDLAATGRVDAVTAAAINRLSCPPETPIPVIPATPVVPTTTPPIFSTSSITVLSPNGGEILTAGQMYTGSFKWSGFVPKKLYAYLYNPVSG